MFDIIISYIVYETIGQFPDLYDAIEFNNNDFETDDIYNLVYGDTTATVMYHIPGRYGMRRYYHHNGLWVYTGSLTQDIDVEEGRASICKTLKGSDWYMTAFLRTEELADGEDEFIDCNGTKLSLIHSSSFTRSYFAYIHPESKNYAFSINGKVYEVELKNYDRWIPFMSE